MAQQRNNLAKLPYEIREVAYRMRFDGAGNKAIAEAVQHACRAAALPVPKIHGTTILAACRGTEYRQYCDHRRKWDERMAPRKLAASLLNNGKGPQTVADLALMDSAEGLIDALQNGEMGPSETVRVVRAVTDLQRTLLARREADTDARLRELAERHAAELAQLRAEIAGRDEALARLTAALKAAGVDPDAEPAAKAGGLSPGALRQIEEQAKLL